MVKKFVHLVIINVNNVLIVLLTAQPVKTTELENLLVIVQMELMKILIKNVQHVVINVKLVQAKIVVLLVVTLEITHLLVLVKMDIMKIKIKIVNHVLTNVLNVMILTHALFVLVNIVEIIHPEEWKLQIVNVQVVIMMMETQMLHVDNVVTNV